MKKYYSVSESFLNILHNYFKTAIFIIGYIFLNSTSIDAQNMALDFDGVDDYVQTTVSVNLSSSALTLEGWVYVESFQSVTPFISQLVGSESAGNSAFLRLGDIDVDNNKIQFVLLFGTTQVKLTSNSALQANTWYHIAGTYDGSFMRIYINGEEDVSVAQTGFFTSNDKIIIANLQDGTRFFDGKMDEIKIWSDARTETEIRANMYKELVGTENNLVAYYKLNETNGTTAIDSETSTSYDGTLAGTGFSFDNNAFPSPAFSGPKGGLNFQSDDYVSIPSVFGLETTSVTIECWVNLTSTNEKGAFVHLGVNDEGYGIGVGNGDWDNTGNELIILYDLRRWIPTGIDIGTGWHHLTLILDANSDPIVYLDGVNVYADTGELDPINPSGSSSIGSTQTGIRNLSNGTIDEVRIWSEIRLESDIRENMYRVLVGDETNLVAYYNFDNTSGTILQDFSGNGNDGTCIGYGFSTGGTIDWTDLEGKFRDYDATWTVDALIGMTVSITTPGKEQNPTISDNDGMELSINPEFWSPVISVGNTYTITENNPDADWVSSSAFNTWLNTGNSSWGTASNWSDGVPVATDNIGIYNYSGVAPILTGTPTVNNMVIGSSAGLTLGSNATVNGKLFLYDDLDLNGHTITLGADAYLYEETGTISGTSGTITTTRVLNNIDENVAGLGAEITTLADMGSTSITRGHAVQTYFTNNSIKRYFDITPTTNTGLNATLVFNYLDGELNGKTEADLKLFKSTDGGITWINSMATINISSNTLTLSAIDGFSRWTASNDLTLGVDDAVLSKFQIYPNPSVSKEFQLTMPNTIEDFTITVSNMYGQKLFVEKVTNRMKTSHKIKTNGLKAGIYFVIVQTPNGKASKKMILQ